MITLQSWSDDLVQPCQAARPEWTVTQLAAVEEKLEKAGSVESLCWMCMEFLS